MVTIYENQDLQVEKAELDSNRDISNKDSSTPDSESGLSNFIEKFLSTFEKKLSVLKKDGEPTVQVSEVLGGLARLYERIRTTVEYKGEHVLRRNAIERILKRLVWQEKSK